MRPFFWLYKAKDRSCWFGCLLFDVGWTWGLDSLDAGIRGWLDTNEEGVTNAVREKNNEHIDRADRRRRITIISEMCRVGVHCWWGDSIVLEGVRLNNSRRGMLADRWIERWLVIVRREGWLLIRRNGNEHHPRRNLMSVKGSLLVRHW